MATTTAITTGAAALVFGPSIASYIGTNIMQTCVNTVWYVFTGTKPDEIAKKVQEIIEELDIDTKIDVCNIYLSKTAIHSDIDGIMHTRLRESIDMCTKSRGAVHQKIQQHFTLWFSSYRMLDLTDEIASLKRAVQILDSRMNYVYKRIE